MLNVINMVITFVISEAFYQLFFCFRQGNYLLIFFHALYFQKEKYK